MKVTPRTRLAAGLAAAAVGLAPLAVSAVGASAGAVPSRTATTFTDTSYLADTFGVASTDSAATAALANVETVTYDRFQWLLKQPGQFAFLVGDPADTGFKANAVAAAEAAKAAGVKKVYWFDPNLSGGAQVGSTTEPGLDLRNPGGITTLSGASQTTYGYAWQSLVAQFLGNGYKATVALDPTGVLAPTSEGGQLSVAADDTVVNDPDRPIFDYRTTGNAEVAGQAPADDFFFVYDKDHQVSGVRDTIVASADLTAAANGAAAQDGVAALFGAGKVDPASIDARSQGDFWYDEANAKYDSSYATYPSGGGGKTADASGPTTGDTSVGTVAGKNAVINAADQADWRIKQITYPELVHLLTSASAKNAVILFGGTWCPNTRAVLHGINQEAIDNNVPVVYNFDTVLDGGTVSKNTTQATDPFQTRNTFNNGSDKQANPTYLYGDLVSSYLNNLETEYDPTLGTGQVTYYKGSGAAAAADSAKIQSIRKLQVPFLVGYQKGAANGPSGSSGVVRQWIQQHTAVNGLPYFTEYMSSPAKTEPAHRALGLSVPRDAAIWSMINADLDRFTWQSDPAADVVTSHYNTAIDSDDGAYLASGDTYNVKYNAPTGGAATGTIATATAKGDTDDVLLDPAKLTAAVSALGSAAPATLSAAKTALVAAHESSAPTEDHLRTVVAGYALAQSRKNSVLNVWEPLQFGLEAVAKLDTFFGGLPGGVKSTATLTAPATTYGVAPKVNVALANDYGRIPTGTLTLTVGGKSYTQKVAQNAASFALPILAPGTYSFTLAYPGDDQLAAFGKAGSFTVGKGAISTLKGKVKKRPTKKKAGSLTVTTTVAGGLAPATGKVAVTLKKGKATKKLAAVKLSAGKAAVKLPKKLKKGTWTVSISYPGDANYGAKTASGPSVKVTK